MTQLPAALPKGAAPARPLGDDDDAPRVRRRRGPLLLALVLVPVLLASPWALRQGARRLDFFRVRSVEVRGTQYMAAAEVVRRLALDSAASVWDDRQALERRVLEHPQVAGIAVGRRLPGTLVVRVTENPPVALVPGTAGLAAVDAAGRALPIEASELAPDLPVVPRADTMLFRLLGDVRRSAPALYATISDAHRAAPGELLVRLTSVAVRAGDDVTVARLAEAEPVAADLARRGLRALELDLRFRDQVIARLP